MKYRMKNLLLLRRHQLLQVMMQSRNRATPMTSLEVSQASSLPNSKKTRNLKKNQTMSKLQKKKHPSPRKVCLLDSKSRFTKMRQTVKKQKKLSQNISMQWIFQIKAYLIEKLKGLYKSKMMSMLLMLRQAQQMFEVLVMSSIE